MSDWTLATLAAAIRARQVSPVEVTRECLARIERLDARLRAFITVDADGALRVARAREDDVMAGRPLGPLHGVPLAHKDLVHIPGLATSCGTRTPAYFTAERECTATARLAEAGAVTLGKLNMTELALGPFGTNTHHGDAQNPWKPGHITGGSSSGSGVAVATRMAFGALGTDTGGSIRLPAACCGVVGLKPTYGRVSRAGVMPLSWSLDHVGPLALTVRDAAMMLAVIAGHDPADATSSRQPVADYAARLGDPVRGLRIGVPENHYFDDLHPEVASAAGGAGAVLESLGALVVPLRLPDPAAMTQRCNNAISRSEGASVHRRLIEKRPDELQPDVRARIEPGLAVTAVEYLEAQRLRARFTREFLEAVFSRVDALVAPVVPEPAPALAEVKAGSVDEVVDRMARFTRLTRPWNTLGLPALSVPCGFSGDGRPLAIQIVGRPFAEATVLRLGHAYEQATGWHRRRPAV
jgi:aspartyl-tRNA(Asn)/glutamyl-tRNA(Gln) amidotransferase subunit A